MKTKVANLWLHRIIKATFSPEFYRQIGLKRFRHPETDHMVLFYSLPYEEQKRIHDAWHSSKAPHVTNLTRDEARHLKHEMKRQVREQNEAEATAGRADRIEMAKALKELKNKKLPDRIYEKERQRLIQEIESRALARENTRREQSVPA